MAIPRRTIFRSKAHFYLPLDGPFSGALVYREGGRRSIHPQIDNTGYTLPRRVEGSRSTGEGVRKGIGPLKVDLTAFTRSLPAVFQLLPEYACIESPTGLLKTSEIRSTKPERYDGVRRHAVPR